MAHASKDYGVVSEDLIEGGDSWFCEVSVDDSKIYGDIKKSNVLVIKDEGFIERMIGFARKVSAILRIKAADTLSNIGNIPSPDGPKDDKAPPGDKIVKIITAGDKDDKPKDDVGSAEEKPEGEVLVPGLESASEIIDMSKESGENTIVITGYAFYKWLEK